MNDSNQNTSMLSERNSKLENDTFVLRSDSSENAIKSPEASAESNFTCKQEKRPQFGTRYLKEGENIYSYNAWDNVQWDEEQEKNAIEIISKQLKNKMSLTDYEAIEKNANIYWNEFYKTHNDKFYKDRNWLFTEFPELSTEKNELKLIFEIGCGVGNTVIPILQQNPDPNLHVYCCDFSETAITILNENSAYNSRFTAFVCDVTQSEWNVPFNLESIDIVIMIFVLSSVQPDRMKHVLNKIHKYLKPGGLILFRDYGKYDMSQLRFKGGHCISKNFYVRGEKTFVYFFDKKEIGEMFTECGFEVEQLHSDQRLQVNRKKQLKMYRIWIQGKFRKPS